MSSELDAPSGGSSGWSGFSTACTRRDLYLAFYRAGNAAGAKRPEPLSWFERLIEQRRDDNLTAPPKYAAFALR
jgi:hypothetical protein